MSKQAPKRIAVDFDGTLCDFAFPNIGPMKTGAKQALATFRKLGYRVIIWSCRACHWDYDVYGGDPAQPVMERSNVKAMKQWLDDNGIEYDEIDDGSRGKPSADFYIDDKGIRFENNWEEIAMFVLLTDIRRPEPKTITSTDYSVVSIADYQPPTSPVPDTPTGA